MAHTQTFISRHGGQALILALSGGFWFSLGAAQSGAAAAPASPRVVEEKTIVETKRTVETRTVDTKGIGARKTAIFVDNRAGTQLNDKVLFFEDQVASRADGKHFSIISREDVLKAVKLYRGTDVSVRTRASEVKESGTASGQANVKAADDQRAKVVGSTAAFPEHAVQGGRVDSQATKEQDLNQASKVAGQVDTAASRTDVQSRLLSNAERNTLGTKLDRSLSDSSSALRLAQNMGADFILFVSIGSLGKETKSFNDPSIGVQTKNLVYNLRGTYKVVEGVTGGTLGGDAFRTSKTIRQTENLQIENDDIVNGLLEEAAEQVAYGLASKAAQFVPPAIPGKVEISIACGVKDLVGNEITLPDIRLTENNTVTKGGQELPVQGSATIEVDGFAMGTTPARIKVAPGAHALRLTRPGFNDVELHINATEGLSLTPTLQLSEQGFQRWKNIRTYLDRLDTNRKLTDAMAEDIRGHAQMLRQSGIRVDFRMNTTNAPTFIRKNSIFGQDNF